MNASSSSTSDMSPLRVTNITANIKTERRFNLKKLLKMHNIRASKESTVADKVKRFSSVVQRLTLHDGHQVTALIYSSGQVVLVGSRSCEQVIEAVNTFLETHHTSLTEPASITNYAMSAAFSKRLNLSKIYELIRQNISPELCFPFYEIELFPSLSLSKRNTNTKAILFHSGKIIITGCKTVDDGQDMFLLIQSVVNKCS